MEMNQRSRFTRMAACLLVCLALAFCWQKGSRKSRSK